MDDTVFRVPREGFEKSSTFLELHGLKKPNSKGPTSVEVNNIDDVVEIKDVKACEFSAFLKLLIRPYVNQTFLFLAKDCQLHT